MHISKKHVYFLILLIAVLLLAAFYFVNKSAPVSKTNFDAGNAEVGVSQLSNYERAKVLAITNEQNKSTDDYVRIVQSVSIRLLGESKKGQEVQLSFETESEAQKLKAGDTVVVVVAPNADLSGGDPYVIVDQYRLPYLAVLVALFLLLAVLFGRLRGVTSVVGLAFSIFLLIYFIVPHILSGQNPIVITMVGSFIIVFVSIFLAHGFSQRTSLAVISTIVTLGLAQAIAYAAVHYVRLLGNGSEEAYILQAGSLGAFNLQGLLFTGIIIGTLGILDDVTTAQTAAVDEIYHTDPNLSFRVLFQKGMSIGREHIASLINTLVLAYAGAFFPLFLLIVMSTAQPLWVTLNSEFISEEIVRTLVGSIVLVLAVPLSTMLASWYFKFSHNDTNSKDVFVSIERGVKKYLRRLQGPSSEEDNYWEDKTQNP